ncbi:MAG: winged helix DNA-binding domain-containing protein [Propionibacteriales bacterium]|nr:winged helix DNA-binding domain-containing protein [Propionibacteriales bacterium]
MNTVLTAAQARRIALAAQGFGQDRDRVVGAAQVRRELRRLGQFQIDSVNVCVRAHYMPAFARLGAYDRSLVDALTSASPRRGYEYWGHAACILDVELEPALRWRTHASRAKPWKDAAALLAAKPELIDKVRSQLAARGPLTARQVEHDQEREPGSWWNWSEVKTILEWLFVIGEVSSAGRNTSFERRYALTERVLPAPIRNTATPSEDEARLTLARRAAAALGVFTETWLAEYFYTDRAATTAALATLIANGEVVDVSVRGWRRPAYLWADARRPRRVTGEALVAPFDSLVFDRDRLAETFGVQYKIGLYTPKEQRVHGYYVYLFVMDDQIVARVDLKADRLAGRLLVQSAWLEDGAAETETASRLAGELRRMADWLGLGEVEVQSVGTLASALAPHCR